MTTPQTRILFVGDMHLGTDPARLPSGVGRPADFGPGEAWRRTVQAAIDHRVHAVALAGDVVNQHNALFEAARDLRDGVKRLDEAGIPVVAIAGNHDTRALPDLVTTGLPLKLLGRGGRWESFAVQGDGPGVRLVGWSFPDRHHDESPLAAAPPPPAPDVVTFGLLHGDLDKATSRYAPVSGTGLKAVGYDGWFLGHVHAPDPIPADGSPFYLGSLTGTDPGEPGEHGPVLVCVSAGVPREVRRLPLAPLRWESWTLDCPPTVADDADLRAFLLQEIETRTEALSLQPGTALGLRLVLGGQVDDPLGVAAAAAKLGPIESGIDGVTVFVDRFTVEVSAVVDVPALARGDDPPGLLAQRILLLESGGTTVEEKERLRPLLARLRQADADTRKLIHDRGAPTDDELRRRGARAARRLLDRVLASRGGAA
jgi:exonuclease SbcD